MPFKGNGPPVDTQQDGDLWEPILIDLATNLWGVRNTVYGTIIRLSDGEEAAKAMSARFNKDVTGGLNENILGKAKT